MLQLSAALLNKPVLSLQTHEPVAIVVQPICNPNNLKIEGFYCKDSMNGQKLVLLEQDIREFSSLGFIVNDYSVLTDPQELVRLRDILDLNFDLIGKTVETVSGEKVGKVNDYATETTTMFVQKIYAAQSILKSFTGGSLSIDRTQIVEITPRRIIINDLLEQAPAIMPAAAS